MRLFQVLLLLLFSTSAYALPLRERGLEDLFLPRRTINKAALGVSAFVNDTRFGTISNQFNEVSSLGIKNVRILFVWSDQVQPSPTSSPNFSFYDSIANSLPANVSAIVVLNGLPSWVANSKNQINGNPRSTFVQLWIKKVAARYKNNRSIAGFQIWNEPNMLSNTDNSTLNVVNSPANYVSMMAEAQAAVKFAAPGKLVINGATTAINQNYPKTLNYNKSMISSGILNYVDVFAAHFYGKQVENVLRPKGVKDFIRSIKKNIWFTESGEKGVNKQKDYAQRVFPFLLGLSSFVKRVYIYQFTEDTPASSTYGLKNLTPGFTVSDLYIYLRDNR